MRKAFLCSAAAAIIAASSYGQCVWDKNANGTDATNPCGAVLGNRLYVNTTTAADGVSVDGTMSPAINLRNAGTVKAYLGLATANANFFNDAVAGDLAIRSETSNILLGRLGNNTSTMAIVGTSVGIGGTPLNRLYVNAPATADGISIDGTMSPAINFRNAGQVQGYYGLATGPGGFFSDAVAGDLAIRSETGNILLGRLGNNNASTLAVVGTSVGIGTSTTSALLTVGSANGSGNKLTVNGDATFNGSVTAARVVGAVYQDIAEWVPSSTSMPAGTVVIVEQGAKNTVAPSSQRYDTRVAGVVSAQPGVILGVEGPGKSMIATTGRVKVRVDASAGPVQPGDLLVSSDKPGMAMKSEPVEVAGVKFHRPGTLIGKALEGLPGGEGEILVLLSLQ